MGTFKRGSHAFRTASGRTLPIRRTTSAWSEASTRSAEKRAGSPSEATTERTRSGATSASTTRSNASRRWAIAAKAAPTPPAPTTSTFIGLSVP